MKDEHDFNDEAIMKMLFGEEKAVKDGSENSKTEQQIFMEVFYGTEVVDASNGALSTNFNLDECFHSKSLDAFSWENSDLASFTSVKDSFSEGFGISHSHTVEIHGSEYFLESSASWAGPELYDWNTKRMKHLSSDELNCDISCVSDLDTLHFEQKTFLPNCGQDMLSGCGILKGHEETNESGVLTGDISISSSKNYFCKDVNLLLEAKSVLSPVSQESFASGLLAAGTTNNPSDIPMMDTCLGVQASSILDMDFSDFASKRDLVKDLPNLLSGQANRLLTDAGWKVLPRVRNDRVRMASNFIPPGGKPIISSLCKAWKQCGLQLHGNLTESEVDESGRTWNNIDSFWDDLIDTLIYIEKNTLLVENATSLLRRWELLDPFIAVVCIDRKISLLRDGAMVKAVNSAAVVLSGPTGGKGKELLPQRCDPLSKNPKLGKRKKCSCSGSHKKNAKILAGSEGQDFYGNDCSCLKSCKVSNYNSQAKDSSASVVPVLGGLSSTYLENITVSEISAGQSVASGLETQPTNDLNLVKVDLAESSSPVQESGLSSEPNPDFLVTNEKSIDIEGSQYEESFLAKPVDGSGKKPRKKSKRISEIGTSSLVNSHEKGNNKSPIYNADRKIDNSSCILEESLEGCKLTSQCSKKDVGASPELEVSSLIKMGKNAKLGRKAKKHKGKKGNIISEKKRRSSRGLSSLRKSKLNCSEKLNVVSDDYDIVDCVPSGSEDLCATVCKSSDYEYNKKIVDIKNFAFCRKSGHKRPRRSCINDDDLLIASVIKKKDYSSCSKRSCSKVALAKRKKLEKLESLKKRPKLLLRNNSKDGEHLEDGKGTAVGARSVLGWLVQTGALSLKDVLQYRSPKTKELIKDGWVTRNGILCKCCTSLFSVSDFEAHSGAEPRKSPNLFLQSGKSYTSCQLQAWSIEYKARKCRMKVTKIEEVDENDDTCGFCGDGGDLICCDNCPSTYHQECLCIQDIPEGNWYCHNCVCQSCSDVVKVNEASCSLSVLRCSQCENKYHISCIKEETLTYGELESATWFCGRDCQEVYFGLKSLVGKLNCLDDGYKWTILRCNHDDQKVHSLQKVALAAERNIKLAVALTIMEECFLPMVDRRTGIDMIPHVLYNFGSAFARLNYKNFYTVVLEKDGKLISVASIRFHGATVAELPLVATCSEHRRQGMCRLLMDAIEKMLKSFKIRRLVLSAIPSLVETWTSGFGFQPINDCERTKLNQVNLMLLPGTVTLIKYLDVCSDATLEEAALHEVTANQFNPIDGLDEIYETEKAKLTYDTGRTKPATVTFPAKEEIDEQHRGFSVSPNETPNFLSREDVYGMANNSESLCTTGMNEKESGHQNNISYQLVTGEPAALNTFSSSPVVSAPDRCLHVNSGFNVSHDTVENNKEDASILRDSEETYSTEKCCRKLSDVLVRSS